MKASKSPAIESSDQTKAAMHEPLVYRVEEIAQLLAISLRAAYNLCNTTKDFRVLRIGTSIRVNSVLSIFPISFLSFPYITFLRYFGTSTM